VILLACLLKTRDLIEQQVPVDWFAMGLGVLVSAVSAFLCIHYFLVFIKRIGMQPFVIYRILLGIALLAVFY
jgi:undecaprenyl-diphosphatase